MSAPTKLPLKAGVQSQLSLLSPAKVNLFFRVLSRRGDGFHEIASLYQAVDLFDTLTLSISDRDSFTCSDKNLPMDESNLVIRAIYSMRNRTGIVEPLKVHLEKCIPMQAGLGGGSSNAATALWGFNTLFSCGLSSEELKEIGAELGADVPFFFSSGLAYCTETGNIVEDLESQRVAISSFWLAKPRNLHLATPKVFQSLDLSKTSSQDPEKLKIAFLTGRGLCMNDLELAAFSMQPQLKQWKQSFCSMGFDSVCMTGSGSTFMCFGQGEGLNKSDVEWIQVRPTRKSERWYAL